MDRVELSKHLRNLSKKGSSYRRTICKMAAELKDADVNCTYCAHKQPPAPCAEDEEHYTCEDCPHDCYCKDCVDNSKWEHQEIKEANK